MESSWLGPTFPKFHIYLNQIRAKRRPVKHPLQPGEQQEHFMNTFVQIEHRGHKVLFIPVCITPGDSDLTCNSFEMS